MNSLSVDELEHPFTPASDIVAPGSQVLKLQHICVCVCVCVYIYVHVCIHIYMYIYVYIYIYMCIYIYHMCV
jgi:hypothetical protein